MKSMLGKVEVVRIDVELFGPGRPVEEGKGKMSIWVTDDERHVPIKARLSHDMGQLDITLKSMQRDVPQVARTALSKDSSRQTLEGGRRRSASALLLLRSRFESRRDS